VDSLYRHKHGLIVTGNYLVRGLVEHEPKVKSRTVVVFGSSVNRHLPMIQLHEMTLP
jgi:hypothetical protein